MEAIFTNIINEGNEISFQRLLTSLDYCLNCIIFHKKCKSMKLTFNFKLRSQFLKMTSLLTFFFI